MPFMRRRPLLRAAVVGGGAYMAGKHVAQRQADQQYQDQGSGDVEQQAAAQPAAEVPAQRGPSMTDQLNQLAGLHKHGVLSDDEFAAAKAKLLGS